MGEGEPAGQPAKQGPAPASRPAAVQKAGKELVTWLAQNGVHLDLEKKLIWLAGQVEQLLRDAVDPEATGLYLELWIMARHHGFGAEVVNRFYEKWVHAIAEAMSHHYPDRSNQELLQVSYLLSIIADGVCAVFSRLGDRSVEHDEIVRLAIEAIQGLLDRRNDDV